MIERLHIENHGAFFYDHSMIELRRLEEFIVDTDDVTELMELYATRIKSYPDNRAYYRALAIQCGEFFLAAKHLEHPAVSEITQYLYQLSKLLDEKNLPATDRMMEVFIGEIHNLISALKVMFREPGTPFGYTSPNALLMKNYIRQLGRIKPRTSGAHPTDDNALVDDPFDEMENLGDFVDAFLTDFDSAFDAITVTTTGPSIKAPQPGRMRLSEQEQSDLDKLFLSISGAYIQPVKDFISELRQGATEKNWIDMCLGSLRIIEDAGTKMSHDNITRIIHRFKQLMIQAKDSASSTISREIRIQLLKEYANLTDLMPEAFATSDAHASRGSHRETVIVNSILRKTPGIGPVSRNKLLAAGLNSLDKFLMANPKDLAAVSGLSEVQAVSICEMFKKYKESIQLKDKSSTPGQAAIIRLYKYFKELKSLHNRYKEITRKSLYNSGFEDELRQLRLERQKIMWEINIVLAELNAVKTIEDFRRMVFDRRIQRLDEFIQNEMRRHF